MPPGFAWPRAAFALALASLGPLAVSAAVASCAESFPTAGADASSPAPSAESGGGAAGWCAPPVDASQCSGTDPRVTFFPPIACDPALGASGDASVGNAADAALDDGAPDSCAPYTTMDVFVTPAACAMVAALEVDGGASVATGTGGPVLDEPPNGDQLSPDNWSIFAWEPVARDARLGPLRRVLDFVEPSAFAAPLGGDAYVLEFARGCTEVLRVLLAETEWVPDPVSWNLLTSSDGPVTVRVVAMHFDDGGLVGPVIAGQPITITMSGRGGD